MTRHAATVRPWLDAMHTTATTRDIGLGFSPARMPPNRAGTGQAGRLH